MTIQNIFKSITIYLNWSVNNARLSISFISALSKTQTSLPKLKDR